MPRIPPPTAATGPGLCPRCLQRVLWTITAANAVRQAVNPDPDPRGNTAIYRDGTGRWRSRQLTRERPSPEHNEQLHIPHIATCPHQPTPRPRTTVPRQPRRGTGRYQPWRRTP